MFQGHLEHELHQALEPMTMLGTTSSTQRPRLRLMVIVSDPGLRNAVRMRLEVEGYCVTVAASLEEARSARSEGLDVVLTDDYLRNGHSGDQVIAALREALGVPMKAVLVAWHMPAAQWALGAHLDLRLIDEPLYPDALLGTVRDLTADVHPSPEES